MEKVRKKFGSNQIIQVAQLILIILTLRERVSYIVPKVTSGTYDGKEFAGVSRWTVNAGATYKFAKRTYC